MTWYTGDMIMNMGIYSITNKVNGKRYIGSSKNIQIRWRNHKKLLKRGAHFSKHLQASWNKYGEESFIFEVICTVWDVEKLIEIEQTFLDLYRAADNKFGYNSGDCAENPMRGKKHTDESRKKMSEALKGKYCGEKSHWFGKHQSDESKQKNREAHLGKEVSSDTRKKISERTKGENNPMFGKKHTEESKRKNAKSNTGLQAGENNPMYGRHHSAAARQRISEANKGKCAGEKSPQSKLTDIQREEIWQRYSTTKCYQVSLAAEYGVSQTCISHVVRKFMSRELKTDVEV